MVYGSPFSVFTIVKFGKRIHGRVGDLSSPTKEVYGIGSKRISLSWNNPFIWYW
jgi:hypothetical protein